MNRRALSSMLLFCAVLALALPTGAAPLAPAATTIVATATLPDITLAAAQNAVLPRSIADDRGFYLGGISDLWRSPGDPAGEYWMVTSQGPVGDIPSPGGGANRRTFPVPEFNPLILRARVNGAQFELLQTIPILTPGGASVTGLSNLPGKDDTPYNFDASTELNFNPDGLASEGLVRTATGEFWVAEEYRPSLVQLDANGRVVRRLIPAGVTLNASYPVAATLPAILDRRTNLRGFEGLALTPDGTTLFAAVQSPLSNPNRDVGGASRNVRIFAIDPATGQPKAEYVYRFELQSSFDIGFTPSPVRPNDEMKLSGLIALDSSTLYVLERTDRVAKIYRVTLANATNILASQWDNVATSPTLEQLEDPASAGLTVLPKTLVADLDASNVPDKIEGIALGDANTIAIINDNSFNITASGTADSSPNRQRSQLMLVLSQLQRTYLPVAAR